MVGGGGGGGGEFLVLGFFSVSSGIREVCDDKTAWEEKIEIAHSMTHL